MPKSIPGIQHVTAIADDADGNIGFYTRLLGHRLIKLTVNDDPASYHFYYGHGSGHPGTMLTFFARLGARCALARNCEATVTSFAIRSGVGQYWGETFRAQRNGFEIAQERFGQSVIAFKGPDGLRLELVEVALADRAAVSEWRARPLGAVR